MLSILSNEISGMSAYFTGFDPRIIQYKRDKEALFIKIERELKCLLLTKKNIVCAASHLTTPFAFRFFSKYPILLNSGVVIPALRSDLNDFYSLLHSEKSHTTRKNEFIKFYDNNVQSIVRWELNSTSEMFRNWFLNELLSDNSVLRRHIKNISDSQLDYLIKNVQNQDIFSRDTIDAFCDNFPQKEKKTIRDFRELIYHITGASVLNCESVIPQQEYFDYSYSDIKDKELCISQYTIFVKLLLENIYNSIFENFHSTAVLDFLTFEDIFSIREIINTSLFLEKYNELTNISTNLLGKHIGDPILGDINDILSIREILQANFSEEIKREIDIMKKRKVRGDVKTIVYNSAVLLSSLLSFVPPVGIFSLALTGKDTLPLLYSNIYDIYDINKVSNVIKDKADRQKILFDKLNSCGIADSTELFDIFKLINETIKFRLESNLKYI